MCLSTVILLTFITFVQSGCAPFDTILSRTHVLCRSFSSKLFVSTPVVDEDKTLILEKHNQERKLQSSPTMQQIYWSIDLAKIAQRIADGCMAKNVAFTQMELQSARIQLPTDFVIMLSSLNASWETIMQMYYLDRKKDFIYGKTDSKTKPYRLMITDTASLIGCGSTVCQSNKDETGMQDIFKTHVCQYMIVTENKQLYPYEMYKDKRAQPPSPGLVDCKGDRLVCICFSIILIFSFFDR